MDEVAEIIMSATNSRNALGESRSDSRTGRRRSEGFGRSNAGYGSSDEGPGIT